ncbi:hypothetical protein GRF59_14590 [Paenibacillus sp. HJL G12]|uniref:Uncharacterized protein n=1 Tax=Paenibacillus dendrobii TaxID=2691084 RepID=A0A7X3IK05_9BACL|nr:hypothetical protein [Paenibacillus dendrobii]MWV44846.1 hypothetical protein [Paenibacillus dendrobii]
MVQEMVFNQQFSIVNEEGNEIKFDYFLFKETPVINYSKRGHSFCTNFENQGYTSKDRPDFATKGLVFLCTSNNLVLDWCSLYHELGHVINNHPFTSEGRLDRVKIGLVSPYEMEADKNVLGNMGRKNTECWLNSLESRLTKEIILREDARQQGWLNKDGEKLLNHLKLSREEILLRIEYL